MIGSFLFWVQADTSRLHVCGSLGCLLFVLFLRLRTTIAYVLRGNFALAHFYFVLPTVYESVFTLFSVFIRVALHNTKFLMFFVLFWRSLCFCVPLDSIIFVGVICALCRFFISLMIWVQDSSSSLSSRFLFMIIIQFNFLIKVSYLRLHNLIKILNTQVDIFP